MKGLLNIPTLEELSAAYDTFILGSSSQIGTQKLALYSQWTRFDPRLAEIWIQFISRSWKGINPFELNQALQTQPWPSTAGVLLEFAKTIVPLTDKETFHHWKSLVENSLPSSPYELFFIGTRKMGGKLMFQDAVFSLPEYKKWGYLGAEILLPKGALYRLEPTFRKRMLQELLKNRPRLRTVDYWNALGRRISIRQAERDLLAQPNLLALGGTKGRYFVKRSRQRK